MYSRILELAYPSKFLTLNTPGIIRIALDLLLPARHARNSQPLTRLPSLGHPPVGIHRLPVDDRLAVAAVVVEIAHALARDLCRADEPGEEVGSGPDLRS